MAAGCGRPRSGALGPLWPAPGCACRSWGRRRSRRRGAQRGVAYRSPWPPPPRRIQSTAYSGGNWTVTSKNSSLPSASRKVRKTALAWSRACTGDRQHADEVVHLAGVDPLRDRGQHGFGGPQRAVAVQAGAPRDLVEQLLDRPDLDVWSSGKQVEVVLGELGLEVG